MTLHNLDTISVHQARSLLRGCGDIFARPKWNNTSCGEITIVHTVRGLAGTDKCFPALTPLEWARVALSPLDQNLSLASSPIVLGSAAWGPGAAATTHSAPTLLHGAGAGQPLRSAVIEFKARQAASGELGVSALAKGGKVRRSAALSTRRSTSLPCL